MQGIRTVNMSLAEPGQGQIPNFPDINSDPDFGEDQDSAPEQELISVPEPQAGANFLPDPRSVAGSGSMVNQSRGVPTNTARVAATTAVDGTKRAPRKLDRRSQQSPQPQGTDQSKTRRRSRSVGQYDNQSLPALPAGAVDGREDQSAEQAAAEAVLKIGALQDALISAQNELEEKGNRIRECEDKVKTTEDYARDQEKLAKSREDEKIQILLEYNKMQVECDKLLADKNKLFQEKGMLRKAKDEAEASGQRKDREVAEYKRIIARSSGDNHLSDDQLQSKFDALFNSLQSCVFKSFRGQGFKYQSLPKNTGNMMWEFMPRAETLDQEWVKVVISIISRTLIELFEPRHYFGISDEDPLRAVISVVTDHVPVSGNPDAKAWLESTYRLLAAAAPQKTEAAKVNIVEATVKEIEDRLRGALVVKDAAAKDLRSIVTSAFDLFRLLNHHQSNYAVRMLTVFRGQRGGEQFFATFSSESMEEIPQSEHVPERVPLEVSIFPGLYKQIDEGQQKRGDIVVAYPKVMVRPQDPRASYPNVSQMQSSASKWYKFV